MMRYVDDKFQLERVRKHRVLFNQLGNKTFHLRYKRPKQKQLLIIFSTIYIFDRSKQV